MKLSNKLKYRGFAHLELLTAVLVVGLVVALGGYVYGHIYSHADSTGESVVATSGNGSSETYIQACQTLIPSDVGKIYKVNIQYIKPATDSGFYGYTVKDGQTKTNRNSKTGSNYTGNVSAQLTANASQVVGDYLSVFEINNGIITSNTAVNPANLTTCSSPSATPVTNLPSAAPPTTQNKATSEMAAQQLEATKRFPGKRIPTPKNAPTQLTGAASSSGSILYSSNWSGYVATPNNNSTFTSAVGYMIVPTVTCGPTDANNEVFQWTGIDGWESDGSDTVEQDGVGSDCALDNDTQPVYDAWWEMWPQQPDIVVYQSNGNFFSVNPGDVIEMSVQFNTEYTLTLTDLTTNQSASTVQTCTYPVSAGGCQNKTAEWIVELPSGTLGNGELPQFTPTVFGYDQANDGNGNQGISAFPNNPLFLTDNNGIPMATVSTTLCLGGTGFYDYWEASQ